jgi:4-hydroxybenzoate polyprenyltransferase
VAIGASRYLDEAAKAVSPSKAVLCVDLDGTLCRSDTLIEALLLLIKQQPLCLFLLPLWLLRGKARFKAEIAARVRFDAAALVYNDELVDWLRGEHAKGRRIALATAANEKIAAAVAAHFGFFDTVVSSDETSNVKGTAKAEALKARFGDFEYVGNDRVDLPVWGAAQSAMLNARSAKIERELSQQMTFERVFRAPETASRIKLWARALRLHQWVKNILMFVPLVLAHQLFDLEKLGTLALGFMAFNICASSVYILNDLLDLASDRKHPRKRSRPFAAGDLSLAQGIGVLPMLFCAGFALAIYASPAFAAVLAGYYALTLAYSFDLKRRPLIDVFTLATLYTLRIIAGAVAASVELSPWLLAFSIFLFLSLGVVKRVAEIESGRQRGVTEVAGRGYRIGDMAMLEILGVAAGYASVVVLALYVSAPESKLLYPHHQLLWFFAPLLLYWISRVWLVTHRGEMHDDPIVFALKDPPSRIVGLLAVLVLEFAAI